jgi:hypothetical protein
VVDFARKRNHLFIRQPAEATPPWPLRRPARRRNPC